MEALLKQLTNPVRHKLLWFTKVTAQAVCYHVTTGPPPPSLHAWQQEAGRKRDIMNRWYTLVERVLEDVRARGPPAASDVSLVAHLLRIVDPATGTHLTDAQLLPELGIIFVAGMETSGKTMGWTLCACPAHVALHCGSSQRPPAHVFRVPVSFEHVALLQNASRSCYASLMSVTKDACMLLI